MSQHLRAEGPKEGTCKIHVQRGLKKVSVKYMRSGASERYVQNKCGEGSQKGTCEIPVCREA